MRKVTVAVLLFPRFQLLDLAGPAQTVFDVLYMTIVRCGVERSPVSDSRGTVTEQVRHVLYGVLPPAATGSD